MLRGPCVGCAGAAAEGRRYQCKKRGWGHPHGAGGAPPHAAVSPEELEPSNGHQHQRHRHCHHFFSSQHLPCRQHCRRNGISRQGWQWGSPVYTRQLFSTQPTTVVAPKLRTRWGRAGGGHPGAQRTQDAGTGTAGVHARGPRASCARRRCRAAAAPEPTPPSPEPPPFEPQPGPAGAQATHAVSPWRTAPSVPHPLPAATAAAYASPASWL
mmetsp:Transcript_13930/g.37659  ORF Transcript_13930/g.37659 Transcript_13930/m.37659 type:complete len:212 (-) Transcript_13930:1984-2619(-)